MLRDVSGVEAQGAESAEHARSLLDRYRADVVLLDLHFDGASGLELIGELRRSVPDTIIIVLTNDVSEFHRRASLERGAAHFLDKSRDFERAVAIVADLAVRTRPPNV